MGQPFVRASPPGLRGGLPKYGSTLRTGERFVYSPFRFQKFRYTLQVSEKKLAPRNGAPYSFALDFSAALDFLQLCARLF